MGGPIPPYGLRTFIPYSSSEAQLCYATKEATPPCSLNYSAVCRMSETASTYSAPLVYQNWRHKPELYFVTQIREWRGGRSWRVGEEGDSANLPSSLSSERPREGTKTNNSNKTTPLSSEKTNKKAGKPTKPAVGETKKEKSRPPKC